MTSAAIYARVSSARQAKDETIGSQLAALREHAGKSRLDVPEEWVFADEGHSGATLVRPGLEALRDLAALARRCGTKMPSATDISAAAWREKTCSVSTRSRLTWTDGPREHGEGTPPAPGRRPTRSCGRTRGRAPARRLPAARAAGQ